MLSQQWRREAPAESACFPDSGLPEASGLHSKISCVTPKIKTQGNLLSGISHMFTDLLHMFEYITLPYNMVIKSLDHTEPL